jgi:signal transduction histidine kinase
VSAATTIPTDGRRSVAHRGPCGAAGPQVPAHALMELIAPLVARDGGPAPLARRCGLTERPTTRSQPAVSFDVADRLLTLGLGDPRLRCSRAPLGLRGNKGDGAYQGGEDGRRLGIQRVLAHDAAESHSTYTAFLSSARPTAQQAQALESAIQTEIGRQSQQNACGQPLRPRSPRAQELARLRSSLVAVVSHELRTPLTSSSCPAR